LSILFKLVFSQKLLKLRLVHVNGTELFNLSQTNHLK